MYKILVVDDEILARVGIQSIIQWKKYGYEIIGEAENGLKAYELIKSEEPDIVISDIKMPILDGVGLVRKVKSEGLRTRFIMLSSYSDFNYVKEAMKAGADDYILKLEMEPDSLLNTLSSVTEKISLQRSDFENSSEKNELFEKNISILREKIIKDLLYGKMQGEDDTRRQLEELRLPLEGLHKCCIGIRVDNSEFLNQLNDEEMYIFKETFNRMVENVISVENQGLCCHIKGRIFIAIIATSAELYDIKLLGIKLREILNNTLNKKVTIVISTFYTMYSEYNVAYNEIKQAYDKISHRLLTGVFTSLDVKELETSSEYIFVDDQLNLLEQAFDLCNQEKILDTVNSIEASYLENNYITNEQLKSICYTLLHIYNRFIKHNGELKAYSLKGSDVLVNSIDQMVIRGNFADWLALYREEVKKRLSEISQSSFIIQKAKTYIRENYRYKITLEDIAEYVGFSPNYFSRIFKEQVGINYVDYVIKVRVDAAKELLTQYNYKVYEVSEMVGYDNPHYFSRIFKKTTSQSPGEYKNSYTKV